MRHRTEKVEWSSVQVLWQIRERILFLWNVTLCRNACDIFCLPKNLQLGFTIWPFKFQFSVVAEELFSLNAHCRTVFSCLDEKNMHSVGEFCRVHLLKVKEKLCWIHGFMT
jgi:hypothetical protein